MISFFTKHKIIFYLTNFILILLYLFPGSLIGCFLYDDCKLQPQITPDYIISSNHLYAFAVLSLIGFFTYKNSKKKQFLAIYLIVISICLELFHNFIPERSFEYPDLFGNLAGVIIVIIVINLFKKYENFKN
ncbi:VanZ family protein [Candidatus Pelagibacter sp.]|nr:VanZ family protein [Candidatus Pelagibacter sp.]